ncbi:MAG: ABC transporter permease [Casimicrobiaceae bacterium]
MIERDTHSRYRGSAGGILWSAINPLLMLAVYTYFFSEVFHARWGNTLQVKADFALILFVGLLLHGFLAESIIRAPQLIVGQANLVRKVVFPLELLPIVGIGSALFHFLVGMLIWLAFYVLTHGLPPVTAFLLPLIVIPLLIMLLGFCWLLSSLGVYLRDVSHVVPFIAVVLMFASPVFYPLDALKEPFLTLVQMSPLTLPIQEARHVLIDGLMPDWLMLARYCLVALLVAYAGFAWFQGTRRGFADVL